jgi:hypothetical protein
MTIKPDMKLQPAEYNLGERLTSSSEFVSGRMGWVIYFDVGRSLLEVHLEVGRSLLEVGSSSTCAIIGTSNKERPTSNFQLKSFNDQINNPASRIQYPVHINHALVMDVYFTAILGFIL